MRFGLIGFGSWGKNYIRTIAALKEQAELVSLCTRDPAAREFIQKDFPDCKIFHSVEELMDSNKDAVIICTPPDTHIQLLKEALKRKIPSIVEKPLCLSLDDALTLKDFIGSTPVLVNHTHLFNPAFHALQKYIGKKEVVAIKSMGGNTGPFRTNYSSLWDYGPHDLSMCFDLLNDMEPSVKSCGSRSEGMYEMELGFLSGTRVQVKVGNTFEKKMRTFSVFTKDEIICFDDVAEQKLFAWSILNPEEKKSLSYSSVLPLTNVLLTFIKEYKEQNKSKLWGLDMGIAVVRALSKCEERLSH